jgi:hypothetical protein
MANKGIVYILTNPCLEGWVKIGKTDKDTIDERLATLNSSPSIPFSFRVYAIYHVDNPSVVETSIQGLIDTIDDKLRAIEIKENAQIRKREFYRMTPEKAFEIFKQFAKGRGDEKYLELIRPTVTDLKIETILTGRKPKLNFYELSLEEGSELSFKPNSGIVVKVINARQVEYKGNHYSLTALTRELLQWKHDRQPTSFWMYGGKSLSDIYEEKYT